MWQLGKLMRPFAQPRYEHHTRQAEQLRKATVQLRQVRLQWEERENNDEAIEESAEKGQDRRNGGNDR